MSRAPLKRVSLGVVVLSALALAACDVGQEEDERAEMGAAPGPEEAERPQGVRLTEVENVDLEMRLDSARIEEFNPDDDEDEFVRFTFTKEIQELDQEDVDLSLRGFDPAKLQPAESVDLVEEDTRALIVGFEAGTNVEAYTVAVSEDRVVQDAEGNVNIQNTVPLQGADPQVERRTSAPELVDVGVQQARNRIEYTFDEDLDEESGNASRFAFYTPNGDVHTGDDLVSVEDEVVTLEFDEEAGDQVEDGRRIVAAAGAVRDRQGNANIAGVEGGDTAAPDLESVEALGETQFDFTFDEPVDPRKADGFVVHTEDGTRFPARDVDSVDGTTFRATFRQIEDFNEQVTLAVIDHDAVRSLDSAETPNTIGTERVGRGRIALGVTAGPDLRSAEVDSPATGRVVFRFDEPVDEDAEPRADGFFVITEAGEVEPGQEIVEIGDEDDRFAVVTFPENAVQAADGFSIDAGAVQDFQDNPSPVASLSVEEEEEE